MVAGRIEHDALQRVDPAHPHAELVRPEVLDGPGIAVGHLPLLGHLQRSPRQGEVPRGEDQSPSGEHARGKRQQPAPRVIQCRLVQRPRD